MGNNVSRRYYMAYQSCAVFGWFVGSEIIFHSMGVNEIEEHRRLSAGTSAHIKPIEITLIPCRLVENFTDEL